MTIEKIKFSYSSPPPCVAARRREFLVVQRDVNWLLILEIREWDDALVPTVSTSLYCLQFCFHKSPLFTILFPHSFQLFPTLLRNPLRHGPTSRPPDNRCLTSVPQEIFPLVQSVTNIFEYSNIRIYWSRIYIRTFIRINFSFTNIFGHSFVSNLFVRIYSDVRW